MDPKRKAVEQGCSALDQVYRMLVLLPKHTVPKVTEYAWARVRYIWHGTRVAKAHFVG